MNPVRPLILPRILGEMPGAFRPTTSIRALRDFPDEPLKALFIQTLIGGSHYLGIVLVRDGVEILECNPTFFAVHFVREEEPAPVAEPVTQQWRKIPTSLPGVHALEDTQAWSVGDPSAVSRQKLQAARAELHDVELERNPDTYDADVAALRSEIRALRNELRRFEQQPAPLTWHAGSSQSRDGDPR